MASCGDSNIEKRENQTVPEFLTPLKTADKVVLYSIDPTGSRATTGAIAGYGVLGKTEIKDAHTRSKLALALAGALDKNAGAKCFDPRHVLRATSGETTVDFVICFECQQMQIWTGSVMRTEFMNGTPGGLFDGLLQDARIPLAPKHGPKDKDSKKKE